MKPKGSGAAKGAAHASVHKPLRGKRLYIDVPNAFPRAALRKLVNDFTLLGASIEEFFTQDVKYLVTACAPADVCRAVKGAAAYPSAASPFSCAATAADSPSAADSQRSPLPGAGDNSRTWRGRAILAKAHQGSAKGNLIDLARQWQINIVHVDDARRWIDKEKEKLSASVTAASGSGIHCQKNRASDLPSARKQKALVPPFVKLEDSNQPCRPVYQVLESWPTLNFDAPEGACPFNNSPVVSNEHGQGRKQFKGLDTSIQASADNGSILQSLAKRKSDVSNQRNKSVGGKTGKASKEAAVCDRFLQGTESKRPGYCECCKEKYDDINEHLVGSQHRSFASNASNYSALDLLIAGGPNMEQFLADVLKYHGAHASEGPETAERHDDFGNEHALAGTENADNDGISSIKSADTPNTAFVQRQSKQATRNGRSRADAARTSARKGRLKPVAGQHGSSNEHAPATAYSSLPEVEVDTAEDAVPLTKKPAAAATVCEDEAALVASHIQHATDATQLPRRSATAEPAEARSSSLVSPLREDDHFSTVNVGTGLLARRHGTNDNNGGQSADVCYSTVEVVRTVSPKRDCRTVDAVIELRVAQQVSPANVDESSSPATCFRKPKQRCRRANAKEDKQGTCLADADISNRPLGPEQSDPNMPLVSAVDSKKLVACKKKGKGGAPSDSIHQRLKLKEHWQALSRRRTWQRSLSEGDIPLSYYDGYSDFPTDVSYEDVSEVDAIVCSSAYSWVFSDKKELRDVQKELSVIDKSVKTFTYPPESCLDDYEAYLQRRVASLKRKENHMLLTPSPKKRSRLSLSSRYNPFVSNTLGKTTLHRRRIFSDSGGRSCLDLSLHTRAKTLASDQLQLLSEQNEAAASLDQSLCGSLDTVKEAVFDVSLSAGIALQPATELSSFDKAVDQGHQIVDVCGRPWKPFIAECSARDTASMPVHKPDAADPDSSHSSLTLKASLMVELQELETTCPSTARQNAPSNLVAVAPSPGVVALPGSVTPASANGSTIAALAIPEQCGKPSTEGGSWPAVPRLCKGSSLRSGNDSTDAGQGSRESDSSTRQLSAGSHRSCSPAKQESHKDMGTPALDCIDGTSLLPYGGANSRLLSNCCQLDADKADHVREPDYSSLYAQQLAGGSSGMIPAVQPEAEQAQLDVTAAGQAPVQTASNPLASLHSLTSVPSPQIHARSNPDDAIAIGDTGFVLPPALLGTGPECEIVDSCARTGVYICHCSMLENFSKPEDVRLTVNVDTARHSDVPGSAVTRYLLGIQGHAESDRDKLPLTDVRSSMSPRARVSQRKHGGYQGTCSLSPGTHEGKMFKPNSRLPKHLDPSTIVRSPMSPRAKKHCLTVGVEAVLQCKQGGNQGTRSLGPSTHGGKMFKSNSRLPRHFDLRTIVPGFTKKKAASISASRHKQATKSLGAPTDTHCIRDSSQVDQAGASLTHPSSVSLPSPVDTQRTSGKVPGALVMFPSSPNCNQVPSSKPNGELPNETRSHNAGAGRRTKLTFFKSRQTVAHVTAMQKYKRWQQTGRAPRQQQTQVVPDVPSPPVISRGQLAGGDGLCDLACKVAGPQKFAIGLHQRVPAFDGSGNQNTSDTGGCKKAVQYGDADSARNYVSPSGLASPAKNLSVRADESTTRKRTISSSACVISSSPGTGSTKKESADRSQSLEQLACRLNDASPKLCRPLKSPRRASSGEHAHRAPSSDDDFECAQVHCLKPADKRPGALCSRSVKQARTASVLLEDAHLSLADKEHMQRPTDVSFSRIPKSAKRYLYAKIGQTSNMKSIRHTPTKTSANRSPCHATSAQNQMSASISQGASSTVHHCPSTGSSQTRVPGTRQNPKESLLGDSISRKLKEMQYDYVSDSEDDPYFPNF